MLVMKPFAADPSRSTGSEPNVAIDLTAVTFTATITYDEHGIRRRCELVADFCPAVGAAPALVRDSHSGFACNVRARVEDAGAVTVGITVTRDETHPDVRLVDLTWTVSGVAPALDRVWVMPFNCWGTPALVDRSALADEHATPPAWRTGFLRSDAREGIAFVYRFPARWVHLTRTADRDVVTLTTQIDVDLAPGAAWSDDTLAILNGDVAETLGGPPSFHVSRRPRGDVASHGAWNTWDYYRLNVSAEDVRENLDAIRANEAMRSFVKYIVIDDGWETMAGDWEPNDKFPGGLEAIAREISDAGFVPGVWTAPFIVNRRSRIYARHPDWLVQSHGAPFSMFAEGGATGVWGERYFLDPSHPGTKEHIRQLYEKLRGWGIRYFKTDFLTNPYSAAIRDPLPDRGERLRYHDHSAGILGHHRECMEIMRRAIGRDGFWLGCGSIWATGAGLMDGSRTSGDIAPHWHDLQKCAATVFFNGHQHGRVFLNDPDFLVVRGPETARAGTLDLTDEEIAQKAPETHRSGPFFTADEARMWASLVVLSGGLVAFSDRIGALNAVGIEIVERVCHLAARSNGEPAVPLDPSQDRPTAALSRGGGGPLLGLFNWSEDTSVPLPAPVPPDLSDVAWRDVWSGERIGPSALASCELAGHRCVLLQPD